MCQGNDMDHQGEQRKVNISEQTTIRNRKGKQERQSKCTSFAIFIKFLRPTNYFAFFYFMIQRCISLGENDALFGNIIVSYVTCWITNNGSLCSNNFERKETCYHVVQILGI